LRGMALGKRRHGQEKLVARKLGKLSAALDEK
jgi:hypothetical protein